jgi:hypothetical protein
VNLLCKPLPSICVNLTAPLGPPEDVTIMTVACSLASRAPGYAYVHTVVLANIPMPQDRNSQIGLVANCSGIRTVLRISGEARAGRKKRPLFSAIRHLQARGNDLSRLRELDATATGRCRHLAHAIGWASARLLPWAGSAPAHDRLLLMSY